MKGLNVKEMPNCILTHVRFLFLCVGLQKDQKKTFKSHLEGTETVVYYEHKE